MAKDRTTAAQTRTSVRVPYERQTLHNPNPIARFAHRRRHRTGLALAMRHVAQRGAVLDFGAGTGAFLHELGTLRPDLRLVAHEPFMAIRHPGIERAVELDGLASESFAAVSAFEVCEHLTAAQVEEFLRHAHRLLEPTGRLILSVPVMEGLGLPLKEASRAVLFRRRSDYAWDELIGGMLGRPVRRPDDLLGSHKGFAHRDLWRRLGRDFDAVADVTSPFAALPWWMNSQRFGVFAPRRLARQDHPKRLGSA